MHVDAAMAGLSDVGSTPTVSTNKARQLSGFFARFCGWKENRVPKLTLKDKLPPVDEFKKLLAQATAGTNPVDDLLELANDLQEFEQKYQMSSADFYEKYQSSLLFPCLAQR